MGLTEIFVVVALGWPAVMASLLLTTIGILKRSWQTALAGTVLAIPFTFYLSLTPRFEWIAPLAGIAYCSVPIFVHRGARVLAVLLALPFAGLVLFVASAVLSQNPSGHKIRSVTVDSSVRLEVLDWGGGGRPVLFVGCYLTGHVYDNIAPKLTDHFRVYAVTRRGIGASDHAATGYDPQRRADDILEVITALKMQKPILVGNSCGGDILHTLGARNPERIGGLMYLDAAEDPTLTMADYDLPPVDPAHLPERVGAPEVTLPEDEIRQQEQWPLETAIRRAIVEENRVKPDYAAIRVPVVAIYRTVTMEQALRQYPPTNAREREALNQAHQAGRAMLEKWQQDLLAGVPDAKIIELPGANLYMFLSHEADIIRELRTFASSLPAH